MIYILQSDNTTFSIDSTDCDGKDPTIMSATKCSVPITTLRSSSTYNLPWGSSVYAKLLAYNHYGQSATSAVGNGAVILTIPDAPISVAELYSSRTATSLGISWTIGPNNGGAPVEDY